MMSLSHGFSGWITFLIPWLVFLATSTVVATRLAHFAPHSVSLSGQRAEDAVGNAVWYRFALQNNEDVSLVGNYRLAISILDEGRFLDDKAQKLFIGRNLIRASMDAERRVLTLEFNQLPAYDTWSIECRTDDQARSLSVRIETCGEPDGGSKLQPAILAPAGFPKPGAEDASQPETDPEASRNRRLVKDAAALKLLALPAVLSHTELFLGRESDTAFEGAPYTPEGRWAAAAWLIAVLAYFLRIYFRHADLWDVLPVSLLAIFAWGLWVSIRRPAPSISQGYWTAIPLSDLFAESFPSARPDSAAAAAKA